MGSYWFENKHFYSVVLSAVNQPNGETLAELENSLKIYRIRLLNLFKHSSKNQLDRQKVQQASRDSGIKFEQREKAVVVPQQYVDEALILSNFFDLNEILALQLVFAAQQETAEFPGFSRGFCAVYLYYKSQWYLSQALKTLMFSRTGLNWQYDEHPDDLKNLLSSFTEQLWKDGFLTNVLELITLMDVTKEIEKWQSANVEGLGIMISIRNNAKHKKLVTDAIVDSYVSIAKALFYWICQTPLSVDEFSALMRILRNVEFSKFDQAPAVGAVNVALVMSALQAIDISLLENVNSELGLLNSIPFVKDIRYLNAYHQEISAVNVRWVDPQLEGFFVMIWSVTLRILGQHHLTQIVMENFTDDEEELLDRSLDTKPFHWIRQRFLRSENFYDEEFYCRRMNSFITQLIVNFPIKIKEWRARADEQCRSLRDVATTGVEMPPIHFEQFLYLIGDFYKNQESLHLNLSTNFFCPTDYGNLVSSNKLSQTQVSLFKFVRESGEALPPLIYVAYLHMLGGLCCDAESSGRCFAMIKNFANYGTHLSTVSLDHFFAALGQYYRTLRAERSSAVHASVGSSCHIAPDELKGLLSWLDLISIVAYHNDRARISFCDDSRWSCLATMFGLLGCPVPLELKGKMFKFLSSLARSDELVQILFEGLIASGIVSITPDGKLGGIQQELDEIESRNELYPATTGFLQFLSSLMSHRQSASFDGVAFRPYFNFVIDSVLVQFQNRSYKNSEDLWNLGCAIAKCMYEMLKNFEVTLAAVNNQTPGCQLMALMICDSPVFRTIVGLIDTGITILDQYVSFAGKEKLNETTLFLLKLIFVVLEKQELFFSYLREVSTSVLTSSVDVLLQTMNPRTREPDYPTKITFYLSYYESLPEHCLYAVKILSNLHKNSISLRSNLLKYFCTKQTVATRILNGFANCLSMDEVDAPVGRDEFSGESNQTKESIRASTALNLLEFLIESVHSNVGQPNVAHFLLGFDLKKPVATVFQNPGINETPKTCLHAVLSILESFCGSNLLSLSHGAFIEPAYRLLFWLSSQKLSGEPMLRYLRSQRDFVYRHVSKFRLENDETDADAVRKEILGWVMKLAALELQSSTRLNHRSNINRFLKFFFSDASSLDSENETAASRDLSKSSIFGVSSSKRSEKNEKFQILLFLHYLQCKSSSVTAPKLKYFNGSQLSQVISACTFQNSKGYSQCNIVQLHEVLHSEASAIQGTSFSGQLHLLHEEIEKVLLSVVQYNESQRLSYLRRHTFDGWRQLVEICFISCSLDIFSIEQRVQTIAEILVDTLTYDLPGLNRSVASLLLTLTASLRQQFVSTLSAYDVDATVRDHLSDFETSRYISVLDGTFVRGGTVERIEELKHLSIVSTAFRLLLEFMVKSENKRSPQTRALCYGSLMNFIRLTMKPVDYKEQVTTSVQYPSVRERMVEEHRKILNEYIVEIVDLLAKDSFDGPEVSRILARSCLCTVLSHNPDQDTDIVSIMASRGYTEHQVASLITDNDPMLEKFLLGQNIDVK